MMTKNIFSVLFLVVSFVTVQAMGVDFDNERELAGCDKTCGNNPCKPFVHGDKNHQFYYEHCKRRMYIQCDASGGCFEKRCPKGTRWNQDFQTCVHKTCGDCNNNCKKSDIAAGKFFRKHCTDDTKYRQCDEFGGCFVMDCPDGTVWKNTKNTCAYP